MHVRWIPLVVILLIACLFAWGNRRLVPQPWQNVAYVVIVIIAALFILQSLGLIGGTGITVSPN